MTVTDGVFAALSMIGLALGDNVSLTIVSPDLYSKLLGELISDRYSNYRFGHNSVVLNGASGTVTVLAEHPEPNQRLIEKEVRNELNRRELNRQRYGIKTHKKQKPR